MSSKVEELRESILSEARGIQEHGFDTDIPRILESLITAMQTEYKELLAKQNEAWQKECIQQSMVVEARGFADGVEDILGGLTLVEDAKAFARGRAEGAEQERDRIERAGEVFNGTNFDSTQRWFMIPASVFVPKGEKP